MYALSSAGSRLIVYAEVSMYTFSCLRATAIISSVHGYPTWPQTIVSSGKSIATWSMYGIGRPGSEGASGPVWPTCVQNGTPSSTHVAYSGYKRRSVGGAFHSHGSTRSPTKPSSITRRRSSRTACIGLSRSTAANARNRSGCCASQPATSSFEMRAPSRGPYQAHRIPTLTPESSIAPIVNAIGISPVGMRSPVHRRREVNMS